MENLHQRIEVHKDTIFQTRRDLHQIPEKAFTEKKTAAYVSRCLRDLDLEVHTGIAVHGVMALLRTGRSGPSVLFRADMDALPLTEATGLPFSSTHDGVMHACGHDGHMAMLLGTAAVLESFRDRLCGTIKFVFQPAEEGPGGAKPMIDAGVMENPQVDYAFACHVWPEIPQGTIGVRSGPMMAAMDRFDLKIMGRGGHGAMPHQCVDALEIGTQVVNALQRVVSRRSDPLKPTVVTVGTFNAGTAFNIIPDTAVLSGTTRTFDPGVWEQWEASLKKIIRGVCDSMGADFELTYQQGYPVTINDAEMSALVRRCAAAVVGEEAVVIPQKSMGGEDFAFFLQKARGCFFALGTGYEGGAPIHSPAFDFSEETLPRGVETFCRIALEILSR